MRPRLHALMAKHDRPATRFEWCVRRFRARVNTHLTARLYSPVDVAPPLTARPSHMSIKGSVTITLDGSNKSTKLPLRSGSLGPDAFDIHKLHGDLGVFTYDPGYGATASCSSKITYIDG